MDIATLYHRHAERILVFLARRCVDAEVAVDLTAETFAQAMTSRRHFRGRTEEEAVAWLFGIARHQLGTYLRRGKAEQRAVRQLGIELRPLQEDDVCRIEQLADLQAVRRALEEHVEQLSTDQRDALQLRVLEELPYAEVALRLQVTEATARARVSRALRQLASSVELTLIWKGATTHD